MNEETRALEELMRDFKEHNTKYAKNYEDVCYSAIQSLQQQLKDKDEKISKLDNLKWKSIKEYDNKKYDWVLVKYFDNDYECIPNVAEKRFDGNWYDRADNKIIFEVKYFMDMQLLESNKED